MLTYEIFEKNCAHIHELIEKACSSCGRKASDVKLLPVTKTHPVDAVLFSKRYGFDAVGENRVQEAVEKMAIALGVDIRWELIGHLQSNKAKVAVTHFDRIQSVDNLKLANKINAAAKEEGKIMPIFIQVNAGDDPAKFGVSCEESDGMLDQVLAMANLKVDGLMTIAPLDDNIVVAERAFNQLSDLRIKLSEKYNIALPELSMGMTGDMEAAIKAGSTMIRVGTALFGGR
jgi:PLP dependent protein